MVFTGSSIITIVRHTFKLGAIDNRATGMVWIDFISGRCDGKSRLRLIDDSYGNKVHATTVNYSTDGIFCVRRTNENYPNSKRSKSICVQVSWLSMLFGTIAEHICVSRYMTGVVGGGIQTCLTLFIAETADDNIRGVLGTSCQLSRNVGILLAYVLGIFENYIHVSMIYIGVSVLFTISFICVPATPQYLLRIGSDAVSIL